MLLMLHSRRMWTVALLIGVAVLVSARLSAVSQVLAQSVPQMSPERGPERGRDLVQRLCISCHLQADAIGATVTVGIPTLAAIANRPGQTGPRIEAILINPHPPMPDIKLTADEIHSIINYLETLRTDKSKPPLLPPAPIDAKPKFPSPT
jgi:mono/diheme cytochrome c family protein